MVHHQLPKQHISYRMQTTALTLSLICEWYDMWWLYTNDVTRATLVEKMNQYPSVFRLNSEAQLRSMFSALVTLYDNGGGRVTLKSLLDELALPEPLAKRLRRLLSNGAAIAEQIKKIRHSLIAHRSDKHTYSDAYVEAGITPNRIGRIITISCTVYNSLARTSSAPIFLRKHYARTEMLKLIQRIDV